MDVVNKLPTMETEALTTLLENARRLERSGSPAQQKAASALLPALSEEIARRIPVKPAPAAKPATTRKRAAKVVAA